MDYNQFVIDTLLWTNRVRSSFYLLTGLFLILAVNYMLNAGTPLLTGEGRGRMASLWTSPFVGLAEERDLRTPFMD